MSGVIEEGVAALNAMLSQGFDGTAKFVIEGEGAIMLDPEGARIGDEEADVTMIATAETFQGLMTGNLNPMMAYMTGKLKIEGSMSAAMRLASLLG